MSLVFNRIDKQTIRMNATYLLFADDGNDGMYLMFIGDHKHCSDFIKKTEQEFIDDVGPDVKYSFYWTPYEINKPISVESRYEPHIMTGDKWKW